MIGIDASRANKPKRTGTEWYSFHLIQEFKTIIPVDVTVRLYTREPLLPDFFPLPPNWQVKMLNWPPKYLWTLLRLSWEMLVSPCDVLFVPAHGLPLILPKRTVLTLHDIGFERFPQLYKKIQVWYHRFVVRQAYRRASSIITISEFSKQELLDVYGSPKGNLLVVPLAGEAEFKLDAQSKEKVAEQLGVANPYFFFVGRIEHKKNVLNIVRSFALHAKDFPDTHLVLAGAPGNAYDEVISEIQKNNLTERIHVLSWVPQEHIVLLMAGALAYVFPSRYEGFGIPILEAMASGTPVITSDRGACAEVAGGAALLVDPEDVSAITKAMKEVIDNLCREELIVLGLARAKEFSWRNTAQLTWDVIKKFSYPSKTSNMVDL